MKNNKLFIEESLIIISIWVNGKRSYLTNSFTMLLICQQNNRYVMTKLVNFTTINMLTWHFKKNLKLIIQFYLLVGCMEISI